MVHAELIADTNTTPPRDLGRKTGSSITCYAKTLNVQNGHLIITRKDTLVEQE